MSQDPAARARRPPNLRPAQNGSAAAESLAEADRGECKARKTFGRTLGGRVFVVPQTHDMVSTLLSPTQPKKTIDLIILGVLAFDIFLFFALPSALRTPVLLAMFVFWRTAYDLGLGYLLQAQSKHNQLVHWASKYGIFDPARQPILCKYIREDIESKIQDEVKSGDYKFEDAPIEYNTWLVFRRLVDLILMNDFVTYALFAMSCAQQPAGEEWYLIVGRWLGGFVLFIFNLWVKLDAHRVVKDYAWYWGDFFYLIDQNLTFDGVFEMAPHPMYSVGYAGYYGVSLCAASYTVLFVSLAAHAAQFCFLAKVENPHIEKTYNPPPPRRKSIPNTPEDISKDGVSKDELVVDELEQNSSDRPLIQPPDIWNSTHFAIVLLAFYMIALAVLTPDTFLVRALFVLHAFAWRIWHTVGIGAILVGQSENKQYVRHFLKFGETLEDAWKQWKGIYYMSLCMTHASFIAAGWKLYHLPGFDERMVLFRHTLGIMLIGLQVWTAFSIYDSLGEFGWFYGDFFHLSRPHLTYSGIYRYLNNPERLIGCAGIWGIVLITSSSTMFLLGLFSHVCALMFINLVEKPHMQKLYGSQIHREAGVAKTIRNAIPYPLVNHVKSFQGSIDKVAHETTEFIEEILENAGQRLPKAVKAVVQHTQQHLHPSRLAINLLSDTQLDELKNIDRRKYSLAISNATQSRFDETTGASVVIPFGEPIRVVWTAPSNHSNKDWVGIYKIADNHSRLVTRVASMGRWIAVCKDQYETTVSDIGIVSSDVRVVDEDGGIVKGEMVFSGEKLFWTNGVYEFRYHHDSRHGVMAISPPFEISVEKADIEDDDIRLRTAQPIVEKKLLSVVQRTFDNDPQLAPEDFEDGFRGLGDDKYSKRIIYAVKEMFGVDFAPNVVRIDGNVRRLAQRICNARKVLAPFSGASSLENSPPASPKR